MCLCALRRTERPDLRASLSSWFHKPYMLVQGLKSVCFIGLRGLQIVCFQRPFKNLVLPFQMPLKSFLHFTLLRVQCFTCRVASLPVTVSQQHLCSLLSCQCLHALASGRAATPTLGFPTFSFQMKFWMHFFL
jgi:hypothetical protein